MTLFPYTTLFRSVYAKCNKRERLELWSAVRNLSIQGLPWAIGGDFNIINATSEKEGGASPDLLAMSDFSNFILDCNLVDIGFEGLPFTWQRGSVRERLDRVLLSHEWLDIFKSCKIIHALKKCSDHSPILLAAFLHPSPTSYTFRFQNMWFHHPDFRSEEHTSELSHAQ